MIPQEAINWLEAILIYDYIRDRKNEKKLAEVKAECVKRSDTDGLYKRVN